MILLTAENINKTYGEKVLFKDLSLFVNSNEKIGLIGINGTGKSTLLRIICGLAEADAGKIVLTRGTHISYLPQNPLFTDGQTVLQSALSEVRENPEEQEYLAKSILNKLGINDYSQLVNNLSGGQRKRVAIARALVADSEILILDEPTNHLDHAMIEWLEDYLGRYKGAIIMVTHDRYFLDKVCNKIIELDEKTLFEYNADYSGFIELKAAREESNIASLRKRQSLLRKETAWAMRGAKARTTKSVYRMENYNQLKEQVKVETKATLEMNSLSSRMGKKTLELINISKAFGDKVLISDFNFNLNRDARIGIVGLNGSGKSTLLKIINGKISADTGEVIIGQTIKIGYFSQESEEMPLDMKVIDYIKDTAEMVETTDGVLSASQILEQFLFPSALQYSQIAKLSGGERRRLYLLKILISAPNVLILDEPTNDLDIETLRILEDYLDNFAGAVIAVSHDRYFLDRMAETILAFRGNGEIREYIGGYTDYAEVMKQDIISNETKKSEVKVERVITRKLKLSYKETRELETIDDEIAGLEQDICNKDAEIEREAANYAIIERLLAEKAEIETELEIKMERWVYLMDLVEAIEAQKND